jgi:hypothetical protein
VREELWKRLSDAVEERDDRLFSPFLHLLRELDGADLLTRIRAAGEGRRKKKAWGSAARWLALLRDTPGFDDEAKLALAIAELKQHRRSVGVVRRNDPALELLRGLLATPMPLGDRLRKDRALEPDDLFYVGFNLAEGSLEERAVAREILEHLAVRFGRTKVGKAAKNKLQRI